MNRIWAPWRKGYIRPKNRKRKTCLFCTLRGGKNDSRDHILKRSQFNFAVLNLYPYSNGHVLIVPNRHVFSPEQLNEKEKLDWLDLCGEVVAALKKSIKPHGFNIGLNLGRPAGAGIPGHLHLHVVPRWNGDVNFMPIIAETRVISESLNSVYKIMRNHLK